MSNKKVKTKGRVVRSKRHRQFEMARQRVHRTPEGFYLLAAFNASPAVSSGQAINDFGRHQISLGQGKFTAPSYVHKLIDSTLGLMPKAQKRTEGRSRTRHAPERAGATA